MAPPVDSERELCIYSSRCVRGVCGTCKKRSILRSEYLRVRAPWFTSVRRARCCPQTLRFSRIDRHVSHSVLDRPCTIDRAAALHKRSVPLPRVCALLSSPFIRTTTPDMIPRHGRPAGRPAALQARKARYRPKNRRSICHTLTMYGGGGGGEGGRVHS